MSTNRNTIQRQMVLTAVQKLHHPSAEEIYLAVQKEHPAISKATVYRNLNFLVDQGQVSRVPVPNAPDRFDKTIKNHYHMQCKGCDKVFDVALNYISVLNETVQNLHGFVIEEHQLVFSGLCPQCSKTKL